MKKIRWLKNLSFIRVGFWLLFILFYNGGSNSLLVPLQFVRPNINSRIIVLGANFQFTIISTYSNGLVVDLNERII
jgi:hypothetical protein